MIKCQEVFTHLSEYLDRELSSEDMDHIRRHLEDCHNCFAFVEDLEKVKALCGRVGSEPPPQGLHDSLRALLEKETGRKL